MTTHKNVNKEPSALVTALLDRITALREARRMPLKQLMRAAGSTQQAWSRWRLGSAPRIDSIEAVARALDAELVVEVRDRRAQQTPQRLPVGFSVESIAIAGVVDALPDEARQRVMDMVLKVAPALHALTHTTQGHGAPHHGKHKK